MDQCLACGGMAKHVSHERFMEIYASLAVTGKVNLMYTKSDLDAGEAGYCVCDSGYYPTHTDCYPCD
jgi:hypothetical protein